MDYELVKPVINFPSYAALKDQAFEVADYINCIVLTDDNIKDVKQVLANARKSVKRLEDSRIEVKKKILESYEPFEAQIKEIVSIVDSADRALRVKVRMMEEDEREAKKEKLLEIWELRRWAYRFPEFIPDAFDAWLQPAYLNKSTPLPRIEKEMVAWMEDRDADIELLKEDPEALVEYESCLNATQAMQIVRDRRKAIEEKEDRIDPVQEEKALFLIKGKSNIKLVEMLLKENDVKFERK